MSFTPSNILESSAKYQKEMPLPTWYPFELDMLHVTYVIESLKGNVDISNKAFNSTVTFDTYIQNSYSQKHNITGHPDEFY